MYNCLRKREERMNYETRKNLGGVAAYLLSALSCAIMWLIGVKTADGNAIFWIFVLSVTGFLLSIFAIINIARSYVFLKKITGMNFRESNEFSKQIQKEIENDYMRAEKNIRRIVTHAFVYIGILLAILLFAAFACGRLGLTYAAIPIMAVIYIAVLLLLVKLFLPVPEFKPNEKFLLDEKEYPLFYRTARRAAETAGCKLKILLFLATDGISVNESRGVAIVCLEPRLTSLLTSEELFNVFLHEFAHIVNVDTKRTSRYLSVRTKLCHRYSRFNILFYLFTFYFSLRIGFHTEMYQLMSSRYHETQADSLVIRLGDAQSYINASAKACMISLYDDMPRREMCYDIYASETPFDNYMSEDIKNYRNYRKVYGDEWKKRMMKELPARISTHPTFRMRMEYAGCTAFDDTATEKNMDFVSEQQALISAGDKIIFEDVRDNYDDFRRTAYTEKNEQMQKYETAVAEGRRLDNDELILCMKAFYGINNDKVNEIADSMLEEDEKSAYGNYFKGLLLSEKNDKACVEHFYAAARSHFRLAEDAMQCVGEFALKTGDSELLEKYRNDVNDIIQNAYDENKSAEIKSSTQLVTCSLEKSYVDEIIRKITDICGAAVVKIYMASYTENGFEWHIVLLEYSDGAKDEDKLLVLKKTFGYLDGINDVNFILYDSDDKRKLRAVREVKNSVVYAKDT